MSSDRDSQKRSLMDSQSKVSLSPVAGGHGNEEHKSETVPQSQGPSLADSLAPSVQNAASTEDAEVQETAKPQSVDLDKPATLQVPPSAPEKTEVAEDALPDAPLPKSTIDDELSDADLAALNDAAASISDDTKPAVEPPHNESSGRLNTPLDHLDLLEEHNSTPSEQPSEEQQEAVKIEEPGRPPVQETTPQEPAEGSPQISNPVESTHPLPQAPLPDDQPETPRMRSNYHNPLPELPDEPAPQQIIVSHHNSNAGRNFMIGLLIFVVIVIIFDLLMDFGIFVIDGLPYTNFF